MWSKKKADDKKVAPASSLPCLTGVFPTQHSGWLPNNGTTKLHSGIITGQPYNPHANAKDQ
jgi:hypothetical protein